MIEPDRITAVMTEAAPLEDEILEVRQMEERTWAVDFDGLLVIVESDGQTDRLMFSATIGALPDDKRGALLELMMSYTFLWRDSGNARIGLAAPGGDPVVMLDLAEAEIQPRAVARRARETALLALRWKALVLTGQLPDAPEPAPFDFPMIRI